LIKESVDPMKTMRPFGPPLLPLLILLFFLSSVEADEAVRGKRVYDGDSILLEDGPHFVGQMSEENPQMTCGTL
jgi:hypothetical protein